MARTGKKRKEGTRTPAGQLSRADGGKWVPFYRVRQLIALGMIDGRHGTPLGRMHINERITTAQFDAGQRFVDIRRAADAALGIPPRTCQAQDFGKLHGHDGDTESQEAIDKKHRDLDRWDKLLLVLGIQSPQMRALEWIAVYEREPEGEQQVIDLKKALNRLVLYWWQRN